MREDTSSQRSSDVAARLERVLQDLPERVQAYLANLETFLAQQHVAEGRTILASLDTEIFIRADRTAEIASDLGKALALVAPKGDRKSYIRWSGEDSLHGVHHPDRRRVVVSLAA